ncbi:MAG: hypothetical protein M3680_00585 [Myxococcota bacterium]|nr:hypothetical protein [Myxococcota bacterium]
MRLARVAEGEARRDLARFAPCSPRHAAAEVDLAEALGPVPMARLVSTIVIVTVGSARGAQGQRMSEENVTVQGKVNVNVAKVRA